MPWFQKVWQKRCISARTTSPLTSAPSSRWPFHFTNISNLIWFNFSWKCPTKCPNPHLTSLPVLEAVMNVYAEAHNCHTWMCKCNEIHLFHASLRAHFGDRLRYVYLHRDPRDVCISTLQSALPMAHYYVIADRWNQLQKAAIAVTLEMSGDTFHTLSYESLLEDKRGALKKLFKFMGLQMTNDSLSSHKRCVLMHVSAHKKGRKEIVREVILWVAREAALLSPSHNFLPPCRYLARTASEKSWWMENSSSEMSCEAFFFSPQ